jgi:hypothetical protein
MYVAMASTKAPIKCLESTANPRWSHYITIQIYTGPLAVGGAVGCGVDK